MASPSTPQRMAALLHQRPSKNRSPVKQKKIARMYHLLKLQSRRTSKRK